MKIQQFLATVAFCVSVANCFPQVFRSSRRSNVASVDTPGDPEYGVVLARTITIGDITATISGITLGSPGDVHPVTTFSGTGTADPQTPGSTGAPITTATEVTKAHKTTSSDAPIATNPWNEACPIPPTFTINNFVSVSGKGGDVSFTITYGNDTYACPLAPREIFALGYYDIHCDNGGRVEVQTDGSSWIFINQKFRCSAVAYTATLRAWSNYTSFGASLFCDTDDTGVRTCLQLDPNIEIPVLNYGSGGTILR
ncbi:hypothetical protein EG329_009211 [Mollisiaceae sp. DMI_Dod_QoI]|nr:hypothetical protein EG329_009211 [Helotiales sp. DMI_Dod_QoI]